MIRLTFLGTVASRPTVGRNVAGIAVQREGDLMLWDCGEGTQRQMMRYQTGFAVHSVFVTHLHADHFLGVTGLLRTMALQGRVDPLGLFGPRGSGEVLSQAVRLGVERVPFPVEIRELVPGESVSFGEYEVVPFAVRHGTPSLGYALREHPRLGRFDVERARALGIPEGPLYGQLHRGEAVEVAGRTVHPREVVGEPRPGRLVVYAGDSRPALSTLEMARGADLLIHEATFCEEEAARAAETNHSTAAEAAQLASDAGVDRLVLTHISARYSDNPLPVLEEAVRVFPGAQVAYDGLLVEIGYRPDPGIGAEIPAGSEEGPGHG
jgi:ribonuclease Z